MITKKVKKKIVLIEDDVMLGQNLTEMLTQEGFEVKFAHTAQEGIELIRKILPDRIISDILLPEFDGFELKKVLNKDPLTSLIPFIFLTAKASKSEIRQGMDLGADDYLTKPLAKEDLLNSINSRLYKSDIFEKHSIELRKSIAMALPHEFNNPLTSILGYSELIMDLEENTKLVSVNDIISYAKGINGKAGNDFF